MRSDYDTRDYENLLIFIILDSVVFGKEIVFLIEIY